MFKIDCREHALISTFQKMNISIETGNLDLGDIIINGGKNQNIIIERKTIPDLLSSIKDGRYREQMLRLTSACEQSNHNIYYLIEGGFGSKNAWMRVSDKDVNLVHSTMFSMSYYSGFSILRSQSIEETASMIIAIGKKLERNPNRQPFFVAPTNTRVEENEEDIPSYCNVIQKKKGANITPDNIHHIMLQQIPGVSSVIATAIFSIFDSIHALTEAIVGNKECLNGLMFTNTNGRPQKINKTTLSKIIHFLHPIEIKIEAVVTNTNDIAVDADVVVDIDVVVNVVEENQSEVKK